MNSSYKKRLILPQPIVSLGQAQALDERGILEQLDADTVLMMGDNPVLPSLPRAPGLLDFFRLRFHDLTFRHLLQSAKRALDQGLDATVVLSCLLHDISNAALIRTDHGYCGAQLVAPYVSEEVAWAVKYHQALRYFADESVGYRYPEAYVRFFGADYQPPAYIVADYETARAHRWYMTARLVMINDVYSFEEGVEIDPAIFTDVIGRHFKQPQAGLGFDGSPSAHMWRTMIWPHNAL